MTNDALGELCDILQSIGATITLYGKPVTEPELRAHVEGLVDCKLESMMPTQNVAEARERFLAAMEKQP